MISPRLPDEIITYIVLQLDLVDVLRCLRVSRNMNSLIQTSSVIQYKVELAANDLVPCANMSYSTSAALRRLREQQHAWRHCEWGAESLIQLGAGCRTYELRNGIWAFGHNEFLMDPTLPTDYTTTITCYTLPSVTPSRGDDMYKKQWTLDKLELAIRDFTMDPLVDLLVLVEQTQNYVKCPFRIHIRRLSDGQLHDMAAKPVLDLVMTCSNRISCSFGVQLYGSHVGVLVRQDAESGNFDYMGVWNWRTGVQETYIEATTCSFDDFAFIDASTIMLAVLGHPVSLEVWRFDDNVQHKSHDKTHRSFVGSFRLPLTMTENAYLDIHFDGKPSSSLAGAKTTDGTPFTPAPEPHIFAISFGVIETDAGLAVAEVSGFTVVMRPSLMLAVLERSTEMELEWGAWGPECTRWLPQDLENFNWEPCSFGGRYAVVGPEGDALDDPTVLEPQVIRLFDFRPDVIARYKDGLSGDANVEPSFLRKGTMFAHDIVSKLPYRISTSKEISTPVSGVMIDEGHLVCTRAEFDDEWRTLIVFTF